MSSKLFSISHCIFLILFLFTVDVFDLSGVLISFGILLFFVFYMNEIKLDYNSLVLVIFSISYFFSVCFYEGSSFDGFIKYAICPWACYVLGYNLMRDRTGLSVTKFSELMCAGFFLHGFLNLVMSITRYGIDFNNPFRLAYDFWQNRQISVTTASLYYTPMVILSLGLLFSNCNWVKKIIAVLVLAVGVFATILYQNRTLILASGIVLVMAVIFLLSDRNISARTKKTIVNCFLVVAILFVIVWCTDIGGLRSLLESTSFYARLSGANGEGQDRTKIWASFILGDAWKYPFGGNQAVLYNNKQFVHNTWLDIYRKAGIIPFLMFVFFTTSSVKSLVRFTSYSRYDTDKEDYQTVALTLIGIACVFFVEPVLEANPYIFYLPILVVGAINGSMFGKQEG